MPNMKKVCLLFIFIFLLAACSPPSDGSAPEPEQAEATAVLEPTQPIAAVTPTLAATDAPPTTAPEPNEPTAVPTEELIPTEAPIVEEVAPETAVVSGRTEEGAFFYGDPNAPITLIDYSDFL